MAKQEGITFKKSENFSKWYNQIVLKSELADYAPVQGCMVFRPNGYAIWENIMKALDQKIKARGVRNVYFPQFIPESFLKKEAEHFSGFAHECAWVTQGGEKKLGERLAIRPTSETIMYVAFSNWIRSHRDLPLKINQWCNIVRWESATKLFVRTTEFLWQEGHTVHKTKEEADKEAMEMLEVYRDLMENYLSIPVLIGRKTEREKFAGALHTFALEAIMPDGDAIQLGTTHQLGQNFSKVFGIKFLDENGKEKYVWQTSWGVSSRLIGSIVMTHSDNKGLVLPPRIAYAHVVIVPIFYKKVEKDKVLKKAKEVKEILEKENLSVILDDREGYTPGWKFNEWELKGMPIRIEIGPKDVQEKQVVMVRRDIPEKVTVKESELLKKTKQLLENIQKNLFNKAKKLLEENISTVKTYEEFKKVLKNKKGFIRACWCSDSKCEEKIKEETGATIRNIPFEKEKIFSDCIYCNKKAKEVVYFAKAY